MPMSNIYKIFYGIIFLVCITWNASAEPKHGISMYGEPDLPPDFVSLPYVNIDAPKGGVYITGAVGGFDSLNPHIRKGRVPWQLRFLAYESLMGRSWDEPFTLYGLLAESIEADPESLWVEFTIRKEARFSDGTPVTVEDILWSYETLGTKGHPRYASAWKKIKSASKISDNVLRFDFSEPDRELALIMGLRPILKKSQWDDKEFDVSGVAIIPISSAPYVISDFEVGKFVSLRRNSEYWGRDLPFRRGTNNVDEIRIEFFGDSTALFEAFKTGHLSSLRETNGAKWDEQYSFPRFKSGQIVKSLIPHDRPSGITGFVMNTRKEKFKDWRVREALIQAFNFEFINEKLNNGKMPRVESYFSNSILGMKKGRATGKVAELLSEFSLELLPGALEGYLLPVSDGSERNRAGILEATELLSSAGFKIIDGVLRDNHGKPFSFEVLLRQGSSEIQSVINIYIESLKRLGIFPKISIVDGAQYNERTNNYDFDMTYYRRGVSLSPGNEQMLYWGSDGIKNPGSRNWMGVDSKAAEAMIKRMLTSPNKEDYIAAVRALDRILISGRYVVPVWYSDVSMLAHDKNLKYPKNLPAYGDWINFLPDVWWFE
ncbi:MAG: peptide/nickel transport system substrate-binding protein [Paracoccaceae bacterium]|jgi:peptide/nickel transport system substrate-binding protein